MNPTQFDEFHEILWRLGVAMVLGGAIGVNRDLHHKPAGLRVLAMVSIASALATMLMLTATAQQKEINYDGLSRVIQGLLQGIGFLGAGVIIHGRNDIHGLTTAASIWLTAVLGIACGLGMWQMALAAFVVSVIVLTIGRRMEKLIRWTFGPNSEKPNETPPADSESLQ
jgi:putative Mg2+ transporter-C (MgtC) family protein